MQIAMLKAKRPHAAALQDRQDQAPEPSRQHLGIFEAWRLRSLGKQDGHAALPKQDESDNWVSPLLRKETDSYQKYCANAWQTLQVKHEDNHRNIKLLCIEIDWLEEQLVNLQKKIPVSASLSGRTRGEEHLSDDLIRTRRQREHEKHHGGFFSKLRQAEDKLEADYQKLAELHTTVQTAEQTTRTLCEREYEHIQQRITEYMNGVHRTHPWYDALPETVEIVPDAAAEQVYVNNHKQTEEDVRRILARHQGITNAKNVAVNNNGMEGQYVSKQKPRQVSRIR